MPITFKQVTKRYGNTFAVKDINFTFERGKVYGVLGPNGSGKSTTLKMIAGLVQPDKGEVLYENQSITRKIAKHVAYLTELDMFYDSFTVDHYIKYYSTQFEDFQLKKAEELVAFMKLDRSKKLKHLSKGNRGRLKLVLTLSRDTDVLLLDEPFSGLDPMVRDSIVKGLISFIDFEKQTVIITTHEIDEIEAILDEAYVINDGLIQGHCLVEDLRETQGLSVLEWLKKLSNEKGV